MTTMDRLTDESLRNIMSDPHWASDRDAFEMAREILAHRRASQAAPAPQKPVAWAETDHKGKVIGVSMNQYPWHPTPLYAQAAPAPSDGLREAAQTLLDGAETGSLAELHHAISDMFGVVDGSDKEDELFEAILEGLRYTGTRVAPAPAQEGDRPAKPVCPICKGHSRFDQCSCHYEAPHD